MKKWVLAAVLSAVALAACSTGGAGDPAQVVEKYLEAKVKADAQTIRSLLCSEMEADLEREINTFVSVSDVTLEGMACVRDGDTNTVRCAGKIVATYGTEKTDFPLVAYRVVQEDGEWKWCGETQ
jgi:hypothetical protein